MPDFEQAAPRTAGCHLLKLSPELRCIIYDFLISTNHRTLYAIAGELYTSRITTENTNPDGIVSLLSSCKSLHNEALPVLYRFTRFNMIITPTHGTKSQISIPTKVLNADLITNAGLSISVGPSHHLTQRDKKRIVDSLQLLDHCREIRKLDLVVNRLHQNSDNQIDDVLELLETLQCNEEVSFTLWDGAMSKRESFYHGTGYERLCQALAVKASKFSGEYQRACEFGKAVKWVGRQQS